MPRPAPSHQTSKASRAPAASMKKQERSLIPVGMTTVLPHAARRVRHLEETLLTTLGRWGYQEIIPPTFEYLDVLSAGLAGLVALWGLTHQSLYLLVLFGLLAVSSIQSYEAEKEWLPRRPYGHRP